MTLHGKELFIEKDFCEKCAKKGEERDIVSPKKDKKRYTKQVPYQSNEGIIYHKITTCLQKYPYTSQHFEPTV